MSANVLGIFTKQLCNALFSCIHQTTIQSINQRYPKVSEVGEESLLNERWQQLTSL